MYPCLTKPEVEHPAPWPTRLKSVGELRGGMVEFLVVAVLFPQAHKQSLHITGVLLAVKQRTVQSSLPYFGLHLTQTETKPISYLHTDHIST